MNILAPKTLRQTRRKLVQGRCWLDKVWIWVTVLVTATPFVQRQCIGQDYVLLQLRPTHAGTGVTARAPTHVFKEGSASFMM
jgi:hypothetical protein